ncbi:MAG: zinc-dependent metalloprotease [Pseudomonadota bacterium]
MKRAVLLFPFLLACWAGAAFASSLPDHTRNLVSQPGFIDLWRDVAQGRVLLSVPAQGGPFLLVLSLPHGLGSNDVGLDRGLHREPKLVQFEQHGRRLFLVEQNTRFRASSVNADERASVTEAFAGAVLWSGDILTSEGGKHLVDFSSFLLADQQGVATQLAATKQGSYKVDAKRSAVVAEQAKSFPDNSEMEAILTFEGPGEAAFVRQVAADPASLTMRQHVSMVRLPDNGYRPRAYHPYSGAFAAGYMDFGTPLASSIDVRWQTRFRLEKTNPGAAMGSVRKPIIFYVDRGAPEPVRSALLDGARWWASAFEKAGFKDAYRVELMPEGADPMDIRYNVIQWVHRATRGWSYGQPIADPRTGEIIKGVVILGSQRVRQDILIAESLLAPYGKGSAKHGLAEKMALARLRQLAAHEVGHTLGFHHNFAASLQGNGSVLDYPHPILRLAPNGDLDPADAYGVGVGAWDDFVVKHGYAEFAPQDEAAGLAALRAASKASGMRFVGENDARSTGSAHPNGLLWDFGPDSIKSWDQLMAVRQRALDRFSFDVLPEQRQMGEIEARLVPVYLLHRYQTEAIARLLGGADFDYGTSTDVRAGAANGGARPVAAPLQRAALERLASSLRAETLALPASVLDLVTPPANGFERNREYFSTNMNSVFDPLAAVEAAAAQTCMFLFDAARLNRLAWQNARDARQPGLQETLDIVLLQTWKRAPVPAALAGGEAVQVSANWVVLDAMLRLVDGGQLHAGQQAEVRQQLAELAQWLGKHPAKGASGRSRIEAAALIQRYLNEPNKVKLRPLPAIPPGAPI